MFLGGFFMKNKKVIISVIALVLVAAAMLAVWLITKPKPEDGTKTITVTVVHRDKSEVVKTYTTEEQYLGPVLVANGLVEDNRGEFGLYIQTVDGETADASEQGWWNLYIGEEASLTGADEIVITDGGTYKLVYTIGW
jgi:hypothetical protein